MEGEGDFNALLGRVQRKNELDDAFKSAENIERKMELFEQIRLFAASYDQLNDLARYSTRLLSGYPLSIVQSLLKLPLQKHEKVFCFGKSALSVHVHNIPCFGSLPPNFNPPPNVNTNPRSHGSSMYFACVYYFLGSACLGLERYYESLEFLEWADSNLCGLIEVNDGCDRNCLWKLLTLTHQQLYNLRVAMGKRDYAIIHARKVLMYTKLMLECRDCVEIGDAHVQIYEACFAVRTLDLALPSCLNALKIYEKHHGPFSKEAVLLRVDIGVMCHIQEIGRRAHEEYRLWKSVLVSNGSEFVSAEIRTADMLLHMFRCEKVIAVMRVVALSADSERGERVIAFVKMASAACILGDYDDATEFMGRAKIIVEENGIDPIFFGTAFVNMSILYEKMKDFNTAISLLKRVLETAEYYQNVLPEGSEKLSHQKLFAVSSARLFSLYGRLFTLSPLAGWEVEDMILFMIGVMKKQEAIFGLEHIDVGYCYARLGVACLKSRQAFQAATMLFEKARSIMEVSLGPHHMDTLRTSQTLFEVYVLQNRLTDAMNVEEKITEGSEGLGAREKELVGTVLDY